MSTHSCATRQTCTATLLLITLQSTACMAWHTESVTPQVALATHQPTTLRVTRTDGRQLVVQHAVLRGDTLEGVYQRAGESSLTPVRIALTDVQQLATQSFSPGRTVGLGVGLAAMVVAGLGAYYLIQCSNGACN
jgi:hypothetical protein